MSEQAPPLDRLWHVLSSLRTTAILATLTTAFTGVAAFIPQGNKAIDLLALEHTQTLRNLAALGLTDVFASAWMRALAVVLLVNVAAVLLRSFMERSRTSGQVGPAPKAAPHQVELKASLPERAVEALRESFRSALGSSPLTETVEGSRVTLVFDTAPGAKLAPLMAHVGVILMVLGAGLSTRPPPPRKLMAHAIVEVKDSETGTVGVFDMAQGEPFTFFQWQDKFMLREYLPAKGNLGPAIHIEQQAKDERRNSTDFWVYLRAPQGFDQRHRVGQVAITARTMGMRPVPGAGMESSPAMLLVLAGVALLLFGALAGQRAEGRLWIETDGEQVRVVGLPAAAEDPAFGDSFSRLALLARAAVEG